MTCTGNERSTVQEPFLRYAVEAGWTYLPPEEALRLRRGETGLVLHEVFVEQVQRLNPGGVDLVRAEELVKRLAFSPPWPWDPAYADCSPTVHDPRKGTERR